MMDDDDDAVRTYNCFMPHCRCVGDGGLTMVLCLTVDVWVMEDLQWFYASLVLTDLQWFFAIVHFFVGGLVSSPATSPSQTAVWDLLHFPLVAPPVPPRYTFPNSSFDSCLAQTSNMVHASLAMPLLKNFHLRHNQMAAAEKPGGSKSWFSCKTCHSGKQNLLKPCQPFFCGHLWGGSCTRLR